MKNKIASLLLLTVISIATDCSTQKGKYKSEYMIDKSNGTYYTIVEFEKGKAILSNRAKKELQKFYTTAKKGGNNLPEIKILTWADRDYSAKEKRVKEFDILVSEERTNAIENFLKNNFNAGAHFKTYNMTKEPNVITEFLHSDDDRVKKVFEKTGSLPNDKGGDLASLIDNKASKALVMVNYE